MQGGATVAMNAGGERLQKIVSEVVMTGRTGVGRTVEIRIEYFSSFIIV